MLVTKRLHANETSRISDFSISVFDFTVQEEGSRRGSLAESPTVATVVVMVPMMMVAEKNRRQRDAQGKSRTSHHRRRGNGLRRHVILLIHGNGGAFFICVGIIGAVGRGSRHRIVVAGAQRRCDKHPACPSVCMILHGVRRSPVSVGLHSLRRIKITILFVLNEQN